MVTKNCQVGPFKHSLMFIFGEDSHFDSIFQIGLKPPPSYFFPNSGSGKWKKSRSFAPNIYHKFFVVERKQVFHFLKGCFVRDKEARDTVSNIHLDVDSKSPWHRSHVSRARWEGHPLANRKACR